MQKLAVKIQNYKKCVVDLGTGDGRFVYKNAKNNPDVLFIGIDPALDQSRKYQRRINREKLDNVEFIESSIENLGNLKFMENIADELYINFPWGSLLGGIANADQNIITNIKNILKENGKLHITFGYSSDAEPTETERLNLESISIENLERSLVSKFEDMDFKLEFIEKLEKEEFFEIESSWAKKLKFGQERDVFRLSFIKK